MSLLDIILSKPYIAFMLFFGFGLVLIELFIESSETKNKTINNETIIIVRYKPWVGFFDFITSCFSSLALLTIMYLWIYF